MAQNWRTMTSFNDKHAAKTTQFIQLRPKYDFPIHFEDLTFNQQKFVLHIQDPANQDPVENFSINTVACFCTFMEVMPLIDEFMDRRDITNAEVKSLCSQVEVLTDLFYCALPNFKELSINEQICWKLAYGRLESHRTSLLTALNDNSNNISSSTNVTAVIAQHPASTTSSEQVKIAIQDYPPVDQTQETELFVPQQEYPPDISQETVRDYNDVSTELAVNFGSNLKKKEEHTKRSSDIQIQNCDIKFNWKPDIITTNDRINIMDLELLYKFIVFASRVLLWPVICDP